MTPVTDFDLYLNFRHNTAGRISSLLELTAYSGKMVWITYQYRKAKKVNGYGYDYNVDTNGSDIIPWKVGPFVKQKTGNYKIFSPKMEITHKHANIFMSNLEDIETDSKETRLLNLARMNINIKSTTEELKFWPYKNYHGIFKTEEYAEMHSTWLKLVFETSGEKAWFKLGGDDKDYRFSYVQTQFLKSNRDKI